MRDGKRRLRWFAGAMLAGCAVAGVWAAPSDQTRRPDRSKPASKPVEKTSDKTTDKPGKAKPDTATTRGSDIAAGMFADKSAVVEDEIAPLIQRRADVSAALCPWLEMQIDARIVADHLLGQATREIGGARTAAYLHAVFMLALVPSVDEFATRQTIAPNPVQASVLTKLHALTYHLGDTKGVGGVDTLCMTVAQDLQYFLTPAAPGQSMNALPPMRPARTLAEPSTSPAADDHGPASLTQLSSLARQAAVSPALRRQLLALSNAAQTAANAPADANGDSEKESDLLRDQLQTALDLASGLAANTAVSAEERGKIEGQLSDGLALFSDARTRTAGQNRLDSLEAYRQLVSRVGKMRIPPELFNALAPAIAWAHQNPEQGERVLAGIERFVQLHLRHEAKPKEPKELAGFKTSEPLRRAYDEAVKEFNAARSQFLGDAAELANSKPDAIMPTGATSDSLTSHIDDMRHTEDLVDVLLAMPRTLETLSPYKPRPAGGVDKRLTTIYVALINPVKSPARDEAAAALTDFQSLGKIATELTTHSAPAAPPAVALAYTNNQVAALDAKWKTSVTDLAGSFASGQPMDASKLERLKNTRSLIEALAPAATAEAAMSKPEALAKWADWTLTADAVHALLTPYQQAMVAGYTGYVGDDSQAVNDFLAARSKYEPLLGLITRTGGYAQACDDLPDGTQGALARLATAYEKQPFSDQRFASMRAVVGAWQSTTGGDPSAMESAAAEIAGHVKNSR